MPLVGFLSFRIRFVCFLDTIYICGVRHDFFFFYFQCIDYLIALGYVFVNISDIQGMNFGVDLVQLFFITIDNVLYAGEAGR